jgi:hypothetical protein
LHELGEFLDAPIIQGATTNKERERLFDAFRDGSLKTLVISRVGNFSIDLPEAAVAIQVSGTFGSRQEEAQRLGRVLRPKSDGRQAHFYTVVSRDTIDTEYAAHRQRFLAEQGYAYTIVDADDTSAPVPPPNPPPVVPSRSGAAGTARGVFAAFRRAYGDLVEAVADGRVRRLAVERVCWLSTPSGREERRSLPPHSSNVGVSVIDTA